MNKNKRVAQLVDEIENTFSKLNVVLGGFHDKELNQSPNEGGWTGGQTAEHIIICGSGIPDDHTSEPGRPFDEKVQPLKELFLDFESKFQADPSLEPGPGPHRTEDLSRRLAGIRDSLKEIAETKDLQALCMDMEFPGFGYLTRHEWLWFICVHTQRHTRQIENTARQVGQ